MSEDRENLVRRREIVSGYVTVLERPGDLLRVCANVQGDLAAARSAVAKAFHVSDVVAEAILHLQVSRFTPVQIQQLRTELAEIESRLAEPDVP